LDHPRYPTSAIGLGYTRAALAAAHYIVIPAAVEVFAVQSINRLLDSARAMAALAGRDAQILGCVLTRWDASVAAMRTQLLTLSDWLQATQVRLFEAKIPTDRMIDRAHLSTVGGGLTTIFGYRRSAAASAYASLLHEVVKATAPDVNDPY